jgi:GTP 3',8-cyclase
MYDLYKRRINYLRISVTDRCNLRCKYCMPEEGIELLHHKNILSFDEISEIVKQSVQLGIDKIRITGGEPLVRKGIVDLVKMIAEIPGIVDFGMTTNGTLLEHYADDLKKAGLHRVNISLDTIDPEKFHDITRKGNINDVYRGIAAAKKANLNPIKINCVIKDSKFEQNAQEVAQFCKENGLQIRYIKQMDLAEGSFSVVDGGTGGDCKICNRLRLSANGVFYPCLFSNNGYNIRELGISEAIKMAVSNKPESGSCSNINHFYNIGG